jgi:3-(3-hydroxy-phenyl)propionate hydroxylase
MLRDGESEDAAADPDFARRLLADHGPDATAPIDRQRVYAFHARIADRWNTRRIFLAGDAAHLSPPFAGQGMNSGIRDAANLAWKLAEVVRDNLGPGLLESYQRERAAHAWALIELAMKMGRVMMPSSRLQASAIRLAFDAAQFFPSLQSYFAEMKYKPKPHYESGFIVPGADELDIVGRMLPQPRVELNDRGQTMLDEVLGSNFALLACGPAAQEIADTVAGLNFGLPGLRTIAILPQDRNPDAELAVRIPTVRGLTGPGGTPPFGVDSLLVVRPDRHVMAAALAAPKQIREMSTDVVSLVDGTRGRLNGVGGGRLQDRGCLPPLLTRRAARSRSSACPPTREKGQHFPLDI